MQRVSPPNSRSTGAYGAVMWTTWIVSLSARAMPTKQPGWAFQRDWRAREGLWLRLNRRATWRNCLARSAPNRSRNIRINKIPKDDSLGNHPVSIHVALYHKTHYAYDKSVGHGPHVVRLRPAPHCRTKILSYSQKITGGEHFINWQQDPFSNWNARLVFPDKMRELGVEIELVAEMAVHNPFDFFLEDSATFYPFTYEA